MVDEPSVEDTISILRGLKERYEVYHGVKLQTMHLLQQQHYHTDIYQTDFYQTKQLT